MAIVKDEPAVVSGVVVAAVGSGIVVAVAFGAPITDPQRDAILAAIPAWVVLIMAAVVWIRSRVVPASRVVERQDPADPSKVIAGEANELPTGATVRTDLGERPPIPPDYKPRRAAE